MSWQPDIEYGLCPCGGRYENRTVEVRVGSGPTLTVMKDVSQGACPNCGSRVYKRETLEEIELLMKRASAPSE